MARKQVSNAQKNKDTYNMYVKAFQYFGEQVKELAKPTIKSVKRIKKEWTALRKRLTNEGYIDIPSVKEVAKEYDNRRTAPLPNTEENRYSYGKEVVDGLRAHITAVYESVLASAYERQKEFINDKVTPKYLEAISMLDSIIDTVNEDYDLLADALENNAEYNYIIETTVLTPSDSVAYFEECIGLFEAVMRDVLIELNT